MDKYGGQLFETLKMKVKSSLGGGQLADCSAMPFAFKIQISLFERLSNGQLEAAIEKSRVSQGERRPTDHQRQLGRRKQLSAAQQSLPRPRAGGSSQSFLPLFNFLINF